MTFEDLKNNEKLLVHLTLTDTILFVKKPEYAKAIDDLLERRSFEANRKEFQKMVQNKSVSATRRDAFVRAKKKEFYRDNLLSTLEEKEEWVDVEKYLLTVGFRIKNLLTLLEDPKNKEVFPAFDDFLPYRKTFAETAKEVSRLLEGKDVTISCKAKHGKDASGYWDDFTQSFIDISYSSKELANDVENSAIKRALELESHVTQEELNDFFSEVRTIETTNIDVAPSDIREFAEKMAANNPNISFINTDNSIGNKRTLRTQSSDLNLALRGAKVNQERRAVKEAERQQEIIKNALKTNGIVLMGKNRYVASYNGTDVELSKEFAESLKLGMLQTLKDYSKELDEDFAPRTAVEIIYKIDPPMLMGIMDDDETKKVIKEISTKIKTRCENEEFCEEYLRLLKDGVFYLRDNINYSNASMVTPNEYMNKYGTDDAVKRRYDELKKMHMKKLVILFNEGLIPLGLMKAEGTFGGELSHKDLFEYMDQGLLSKEDVCRAIAACANKDHYDKDEVNNHIIELFTIAKNDKKRRNGYSARKYFEILPNDVVLKLLLKEDSKLVDENDLRRKGITKDDVLSLDTENFIKLLKCGKLQKSMIPQEEDILDLYGKKLFGKEVLDLAKNGLISDTSILKLFVSRKSVNKINPEEALNVNDVLSFYNLDRLLKLQEEGELNYKFVTSFNEEVLNSLDDGKRKEYIQNIINSLKEIDEKEASESPKYLTKLYSFYEIGLFDKTDIEAEFSNEKIEELLMDDVIDESEVIKYFNDGLVSKEILKEVFTNQEIRNLVITGELVPKALLAITGKKDELLKDLLTKDAISKVDLVDLYLEKEDGLDILDLESALNGQKLEDGELVDLIPDDADEEKITELFKKYLISQDDLSCLVKRGVITKEKEEELSEYLNSHQEFEKIFGVQRTIAHLTEITEGTGESHTPGLKGDVDPRKRQVKNDPELLRRLLKELGADSRVIYLEGADNSLDGYEIHGIEDLGVMVFGKFDKPNNAIFIMTVGQGSYFLKSLERRNASKKIAAEDEKEIVLESSATKSELKNTAHVKYRVAARGLGRNIIDSIRELNPKIDEKFKDKKYKAKIDDLVQEIKIDYDIRKEL